MKIFSEDATSEDVQEQIETFEECIEQIESTMKTLVDLDKQYCRDYIKTLQQMKTDFESEIETLEEEKEEKEEQERQEYREELQEMNYQFERSRI